jgi:hypothetical protein
MLEKTNSSVLAFAFIGGLVLLGMGIASTGFDLRNSMFLPVAAAGFAIYSGIAYLVDRRKNTK